MGDRAIGVLEAIFSVTVSAGAVAVGSLVLASVWYLAAVTLVSAWRETYWIAAWIYWCRGNMKGGRRALKKALEHKPE